MVRVARGCVYIKADLCKGMQRLDDELKTLKYCGACDDDGCNGSGALKSSVVAVIFIAGATYLQTFFGLHWETERINKRKVQYVYTVHSYNFFTKKVPDTIICYRSELLYVSYSNTKVETVFFFFGSLMFSNSKEYICCKIRKT